MKHYLYDYSQEEILEFLQGIGEKSFRAKQIYQWLMRGVSSFDEMTDLSKSLREKLEESFYLDQITLHDRLKSKIDKTTKYVWKLRDGDFIESVYMEYKTGTSICVSSQVGCRMGCRFCASTKAGFLRNLSHGELLAQIAYIGKDQGTRIDHIVVMGIGEPMENYDNLLKFLRACNDEKGFNISYRKMTVSTCGIIPQMLKFAQEKLPITLAISLHATDDELRSKMMPINRLYPIQELLEACKEYIETTGRRITFEYALFDGVNDSPEQARELANLLRGMLCHVNLIPGNDVPGSNYKRSKKEAIDRFSQILERSRIAVSVRRELGGDIMAACGQLRRASTR